MSATENQGPDRQGRPAFRVIARLDIKAPNLVKGIHLEGLRVIGNPAEHAVRYYEQGADEILYVDIVASLYGRNSIQELVSQTAEQVYVPLTVGGGIRSVQDIHNLLRAGADKVAINTAAIHKPSLITEAAKIFGSQCIVVSIQAMRQSDGRWEAFADNGRERTGVDAVEWAKRVVDLGAGELLVTSVEREGTRKGFDLDLLQAIGPAVPIPVIGCGGAGNAAHTVEAAKRGADAVAVAGVLHYKLETVGSIKTALKDGGIQVR